MSPAQQGQVGQIRWAAIQPVRYVMALTPGQRPVAVGKHTATVADRQGAALGRGDDPAAPADIQGLAGAATQDRGQQVHGRPQPPLKSLCLAPATGERSDIGARTGVGSVLVVSAGAEVGVVAGDHHAGQGPVTGQPPTRLRSQRSRPAGLPTYRSRAAEQAVQVHDDIQLGADSAGLGELVPLQSAAGQLTQGISPSLAAAALILSVGRAGQGFQSGQQSLASLGLQQPLQGDHALPGRGQPHPPPLVAAFGLAVGAVGVGNQPQVVQDPPQPGRVQAAAVSTSTGSASAVTRSGRSCVPAASTLAWAGEISPAVSAWAVAVRGRGTTLGRSGHYCGRHRHPCAVGCAASWRSRRPGCPGRRPRRSGHPRRRAR
jgi:hypothetical protein